MSLDDEMREDLAGTTAICVIIKDDKLYCGNVGDSRAIASVSGNVEILSTDHKPNNDDERKRITAAGGWVEFNRVNGKKIFLFLNLIFSMNFFLNKKEIWLYQGLLEILYLKEIRINVLKNKLLLVKFYLFNKFALISFSGS